MPYNNTSGYGKRPMWQWVLIYVVVAVVVYGLVYYFVFANRGNSGYVSPYQQSTQLPATSITATPASNMPVTSAQSTTASGTKTVTISNFAFQPAQIIVPVGTTVVFTNTDAMAHTVTSDTGVFTSGNLPTGQTFKYTFTKTGTFPYHCAIHLSMKGSVVVQ